MEGERGERGVQHGAQRGGLRGEVDGHYFGSGWQDSDPDQSYCGGGQWWLGRGPRLQGLCRRRVHARIAALPAGYLAGVQ